MNHSPLKAIAKSFGHSRQGLITAWQDDASFRRGAIQVAVGCALSVALALWLNLGLTTWLMLPGSLLPIIVVELLNTAIEYVTDKASPERHPLARKAKDVGSAAVLCTRIIALIVWFTVLYDAFSNS